MKICLSVIALMLSLVFAQDSSYTFADIPWLSSKEEVVSAMEARGYTVFLSSDDNQIVFRTEESLFGRPVLIFTNFNRDEQLIRVSVRLARNLFTSQDQLDAENVLASMKELLTQRYGHTDYVLELPPVLRNDNFSDEEPVDADEIVSLTVWFSDVDSSRLTLTMTQGSKIFVSYLSPYWENKLMHHQGPIASDF